MKPEKKVLIISTVGLIYDGITNVIMTYLEAMHCEGLDIYVAGTIEVTPAFRRKIEDLGGTVIDFPNRKTETIKYFTTLIKFIKKNNIEIVHAHGNSATLAIEMLAAWLGRAKKRISHCHNTKCNHIYADKVLRPIFYLFYTDAMACSKEAGKWLYGNKRFTVLTNGRNVQKYSFELEARNRVRLENAMGNRLAIGHVGGFFKQKNHGFLVDIYKEIKKLRPDVILFMIGDGPLKPEIEKLCEGMEVKFTGSIENVTDYLNALDGMVLPSLYEGLPLAVLEWQINGLSCVISDAVTRECRLTNLAVFMSLDKPPGQWAREIVKNAEANNRSQNAREAYTVAINSKFNILESAKELEKIYRD